MGAPREPGHARELIPLDQCSRRSDDPRTPSSSLLLNSLQDRCCSPVLSSPWFPWIAAVVIVAVAAVACRFAEEAPRNDDPPDADGDDLDPGLAVLPLAA